MVVSPARWASFGQSSSVKSSGTRTTPRVLKAAWSVRQGSVTFCFSISHMGNRLMTQAQPPGRPSATELRLNTLTAAPSAAMRDRVNSPSFGPPIIEWPSTLSFRLFTRVMTQASWKRAICLTQFHPTPGLGTPIRFARVSGNEHFQALHYFPTSRLTIVFNICRRDRSLEPIEVWNASRSKR
jgi:hypothetical protein